MSLCNQSLANQNDAEHAMATTVSPFASAEDGTTKLSCSGIWKLYGPQPKAFLERYNGKPTTEDLRANGYVTAVRDATLQIRKGETFVIMGLSGSGKSTLVRCLSRLVEPTSGDVRFDGQSLLNLTDRDLIEIRRHRMAMVFQHFGLLPHDTVLGNVAFPLEIQGVARSPREARAMEVIELVGLKGREDYYPQELSGGQQQRVGIARALAVDPEVLFLDEPFSALDPLIRYEMQNELIRLQQSLQKTVVFITHDFDEAIRLADRIAIMQDGEIIQTGSPEELVLRPATDYVREFTRNVLRTKVLHVASIMRPVGDAPLGTARVRASDRIDAILGRVIECEGDTSVTDDGGVVVGRLRLQDVLRTLISN